MRASAGLEKYHQCGCRSSATVSLSFSNFVGYGMPHGIPAPVGCRVGRRRRRPRTPWRCCTGSTPSSSPRSPRRPTRWRSSPAAGSGKTTVLTRRIAHRIATGEATAAHTLALTFTREAAGELRRRLRALGLRDHVEAGTFHAVALRLLRHRRWPDHDDRTADVAVDRTALIAECLTELRLDVSAVGRDGRGRLGPRPAWCRRTGTRRRRAASGAAPVPPSRFVDLAGAYERARSGGGGVVDFDDLLERVLPGDDAPTRRSPTPCAGGSATCYVDEAQDLNPLQHALLEAWRGGRDDLCLVGDPRQAIYGLNGARSTTLTEVEQRTPGVTVVALTTNHRCTPQVVRAGSAALRAGGHDDDTVERASPTVHR